jgi:hypothetical protein
MLVREPNRGGGQRLADATALRRRVDDDVLNPRAHAGRDLEQNQGQHPDDRAVSIACNQQARCVGIDDRVQLSLGGRRSRLRELLHKSVDRGHQPTEDFTHFLDLDLVGHWHQVIDSTSRSGFERLG